MMCRHGLQDCSLSPSVAERVQVLYWFSDRGSSASAIRIAIGGFVQQITLQSRGRHLGGRQWFFVCPGTGGFATVLWKPPGASKFCSRQAWGRQVAYAPQKDAIVVSKSLLSFLLQRAPALRAQPSREQIERKLEIVERDIQNCIRRCADMFQANRRWLIGPPISCAPWHRLF